MARKNQSQVGKKRTRTCVRESTNKKSKFDPAHYEKTESWDLVHATHILCPQVTLSSENPLGGDVKRIVGKMSNLFFGDADVGDNFSILVTCHQNVDTYNFV